MADHGTLTRYRDGCTDGPGGRSCQKCRNEAAAAKRQQRARNANAQTVAQDFAKPAKVVALSTSSRQQPQTGIGPVESAVRSEFAAIANTHQVLFAQACAIAAKMDDPDHGAVISRNSAELDKLRAELLGPKRKMGARGNRLAEVSAMSSRRRAQ